MHEALELFHLLLLLAQGAEKDVILLVTTISRAADFAADAKRLNVALTRGELRAGERSEKPSP